MKFFIDTANIQDIQQAARWGFCDGITTNPTLIAKEGKPFRETIIEICRTVNPGPVSAEVVSTDTDGMLREALEIAAWAPNVVVKIPMTEEGLMVVPPLCKKNIRTNVTLVFSAAQALLAAKAGATFVSPFVGRLDDVGEDGMVLIEDIMTIYRAYGFKTEVITASVRHPIHLLRAAKVGAHIATIPFSTLKQLFKHPLTDAGLKRFLDDWKKSPSAAAAFQKEPVLK